MEPWVPGPCRLALACCGAAASLEASYPPSQSGSGCGGLNAWGSHSMGKASTDGLGALPFPERSFLEPGLGKRLSSTLLFSILLEAPKNFFKGEA